MIIDEVPVLIVGGGPAGLTMSLLLSRHGVASLLVEKHAAPSPLARARGVHSRAMEILRVAGVEPAMRAVELPIHPGVEWRPTIAAPAVRELTFGPDEVEVSPCDGLAVAQDVFESVLRDHARAQAGATLSAGTELVDLRLADGGVEAVLFDRATGVRREVRARYLVAADGARSGVRTRLGIAMDGPDDLGQQWVIAFRADLTRWTGANPRGLYFLTDSPRGAVLLWTHPDHRWAVNTQLPSTGTGDPVGAVRDALGMPDLAVEVLADNTWTAAAQTATAFRSGPVFLIGDAAHRVPPVGATGVSTAMADAHNLAWKLAFVLGGRSGDGLLDTYQAERQPVARTNATETARAWTQAWNPGTEAFAGRSLRQLDMGFHYRGAGVTPDGSPDTDVPGADYVPAADPGHRAPHLWLDADRRRSTIDLFDRDFVLLTSSDRWAELGQSLGLATHTVNSPQWTELYGAGSDGAVLVRPDGHVAWRATTPPIVDGLDQLRAALDRATAVLEPPVPARTVV